MFKDILLFTLLGRVYERRSWYNVSYIHFCTMNVDFSAILKAEPVISPIPVLVCHTLAGSHAPAPCDHFAIISSLALPRPWRHEPWGQHCASLNGHVPVFHLAALSGLDQEAIEREVYDSSERWYRVDWVFCPFRSGRECASLQQSTMWLQNCGLNLRITWGPANTTVVRRMSITHIFFHSIFIAHLATQCHTGVVS